jgi:hypothetical protein
MYKEVLNGRLVGCLSSELAWSSSIMILPPIEKTL